MIELIRASKYYPTEHGRHYIFQDVSLQLPANVNIGVIGPNGAGKSTFLRLLGGGEILSSGRIVRTSRVSWPMGLTPGVLPNLSGGENTRFACRIYGMSAAEIRETIERVRELAGIGKFFDMPVGTYSSGMRQRLSFAITMSMNFDYYLFDEISAGGDLEFRKQAREMVQERLNRSNFILVSHSLNEIARHCQSAILLGGGELNYFEDAHEAIEAYVAVHGTPEDLAKLRNKAAGLTNMLDDDDDDDDEGELPLPGAEKVVAADTDRPLRPGRRRAPRPEQEIARLAREEKRAEMRRQRRQAKGGPIIDVAHAVLPAGEIVSSEATSDLRVLRQARLERRAKTLNERRADVSSTPTPGQLKR